VNLFTLTGKITAIDASKGKVMTFAKWHRENEADIIIWANKPYLHATEIHQLFEACWHDGYKVGYQNGNERLSHLRRLIKSIEKNERW